MLNLGLLYVYPREIIDFYDFTNWDYIIYAENNKEKICLNKHYCRFKLDIVMFFNRIFFNVLPNKGCTKQLCRLQCSSFLINLRECFDVDGWSSCLELGANVMLSLLDDVEWNIHLKGSLVNRSVAKYIHAMNNFFIYCCNIWLYSCSGCNSVYCI